MLPSDFPKWQVVYFHYRHWMKASSDEASLLEQALKKCSWRGPYETGAERQNKLLYS
ncbi:putative transposase [bacterium endosymbiont of Mortierella elongata FMR23-6]|nr:putative transposase [bacterium endosymbiont of Mortierella elongata FMR23-6]